MFVIIKVMNILELKSKVSGEFSTEEKDLESNSRDASIFQIKPTAIYYPKNAKECSELVSYMNERKGAYPDLCITARAAGTDMSGGSVGEGIIASFTKYMNHIVEIKNNSAITEPGVFYRDFEKETLKQNLLFPSYPASREIAALGGIVSNNSGGEKTLSFGKTKDYVDSLEVVLSNGEIITTKPLNKKELSEKFELKTFEGEVYRKLFALLDEHYDTIKQAPPPVTKNSAGYLLWEVWNKEIFDLGKIFVGAQGTLGLITKIKLKLITPSKHSRLLVIFINDISNLGEIVNSVMKYKPETFESFDDKTFKLAVKFAPEMMKRMKGGIIKLGLQFLPEVWMTLTGGIPKLMLLAEFTGNDESEIIQRLQECKKEVEEVYNLKTHLTKSAEETQKYWVMRRESFNLLRQKIKNLHTAPFIDDTTVPVKHLPEFLPKLNAILANYPSLIYTVAGHMGDANFHIIPLMDLSKKEEREIIPKLSEEVYNLVLSFKGSTTAEHNDGLVRGQYLEQMYGKEVFQIMKDVKTIFDPKNIFNPHKKTQATWEYSLPKINHY